MDLCSIRFPTQSKTALGDSAFLSLLAISLSPRLYPITVAANKPLVYGPDLRHSLMIKAAMEAVDRVFRPGFKYSKAEVLLVSPSMHDSTGSEPMVPQDAYRVLAVVLRDGCDLMDVIKRRLQAELST
jgi:hypothetical protein